MTVAEALRAAGLRIDRFDAEVLLAHLLGVSRGALLVDSGRTVDGAAFAALVDRRAGHEPVAYITGLREFWSLELRVTPDVLIPRPDSETLIEAALRSGVTPARVLDLGTGSGALLLAALTEFPGAAGLGLDASAPAVAVARANAAQLGFGARADFRLGNWGAGISERFDLILCNPPYVETDAELAPDVGAFEPGSALFAGADGLDDYRRIMPQLPGLLAPGGVAVIEIGHTQADAVLTLAVGMAGMVAPDLAGRDRCLVLRAAPRPGSSR